MLLQDHLNERQAQTHAGAQAGVEGVVSLRREVGLSAMLARFRRHADAVVVNLDHGLAVNYESANQHASLPAGGGDQGLPMHFVERPLCGRALWASLFPKVISHLRYGVASVEEEILQS